MTTTTLEPTTIEELDFEIACQSPDCHFGFPPATHIASSPCGCSLLVCTESAKLMRRNVDDAITLGLDMMCILCEQLINPVDCTFEPLP